MMKITVEEESILKEIDKSIQDYIKFLKLLIKTDSSNPPGNEGNIATIVKNYLDDQGIKCDIFPFNQDRANLIAYLNDNFDSRILLLNGHMDTVPFSSEDKWKYHPLSGEVEDNKFIYGRGAADMKGGLAAMVITLKILKKYSKNFNGNIILNAVADEEQGGDLGTKWCVDNVLKNLKCDFAIVGEYSGFNPFPKSVIIGEKGRAHVKITTHGISCHASTPFLGKNAAYMMTDIIQNIDKITKYIPDINPPLTESRLKEFISQCYSDPEEFNNILRDNPYITSLFTSVTQFTKALTTLNCGIKENIIPDKCEAVIDFRLLPGQDSKMIVDGLEKFLTDLGYMIDNSNTKEGINDVDVKLISDNKPSFIHKWRSSTNLSSFFKIVESIYKEKPFPFITPATTDAEFLRSNGYCPETIIFGPGSFENIHTVNEHIEIQDFINCIKVYSLFAFRLLSSL